MAARPALPALLPLTKRVASIAGGALILLSCSARPLFAMNVKDAFSLFLLGIAILSLHWPMAKYHQFLGRSIGISLLLISGGTPWAIRLLDASLLFLPSPSSKKYWLGQLLILTAGSMGFYQALNYSLEMKGESVFQPHMPLATLSGVLLSVIGLFCLNPHRGIIGLLTKSSAGGMLARRLLPWALGIPLLLWWFRIYGQAHHFYSEEQGFALFFTLTLVTLVILITRTALRLHDMDSQRAKSAEVIETHRKALLYSSKMSALGEMASGIAHEINNPLSVIYGEAEGLRELATAKKLNFEEVARLATKIEATTERISRIVKGLRTFARDSREEPFVFVPLYQILEDTLAFCRERFKIHKTQLEVAKIPLSLQIECRRVQLSQVFLNLLNNAFDAVHNQEDRQVRIDWKEIGPDIELQVSDNGPGIPEKIRDKIFQPFFTTKEVGKGTGLGLSIANGIIEAHQGSLRVETPPTGNGSVFKVLLPRVQAKDQKKAA